MYQPIIKLFFPYLSALDFWHSPVSSLLNWIFTGYTGSKNIVQTGKKIKFCKLERAIFHTFWRLHCCLYFLFILLDIYFKFWLLPYFLILLNCEKFEEDWTTFMLDILQGSLWIFDKLQKQKHQKFEVSSSINKKLGQQCTLQKAWQIAFSN